MTEYTTTDGQLALGNLDAQIDGLAKRLSAEPGARDAKVALIAALLARGQYRGRIADYEQAEQMAELCVRRGLRDGEVLLLRAHVRSTFHRFREAMADLDEARKTIKDGRVEGARAQVLQAVGRYDEALALREQAARLRRTLPVLMALAQVHADRGELDQAEALYTQAQLATRDVSPMPLAFLYLSQGLLWQREGRLARAKELFQAAVDRLPSYAPAISHLAAVEAMTGERQLAIERLRALVTLSDDPAYAGELSVRLRDAGQRAEADQWALRARKRYDELVTRHPDAFADHAARFWMDAGGDAKRALVLAQRNLEQRKTPDAYELVIEAAIAAGQSRLGCALADGARERYDAARFARLASATATAYRECGREKGAVQSLGGRAL